MRLETPQSGEIIFEGEDILRAPDKRLKALRPRETVTRRIQAGYHFRAGASRSRR